MGKLMAQGSPRHTDRVTAERASEPATSALQHTRAPFERGASILRTLDCHFSYSTAKVVNDVHNLALEAPVGNKIALNGRKQISMAFACCKVRGHDIAIPTRADKNACRSHRQR